ncbi:RNA polymerase sigma factor [Conexibacter woesei]|uniref:RNA polymerase sigma factor n=1 Tax=Conexibacter woesei TaxID=191495 RepID=UPI000686EF19|nr:sigma-70 family RNA polymerase sigma factor [Conexibacter woesei]
MNKTGLRHPARLAGSSFLRLQSDERLAELATAGHDAAFDAIVVRYRPALLRYCGAIVGSSRAEDAVQQTLLNAHTALGDADEVRHLRSWLYRIAHNVSLNLLRSVRDDVSLDADGAEGLRLPAPASPVESFEASEQFRATVAALQALPERQRAALVLRELEGRSHEEIASALGVSAGSARQHLMRARVAMRGAVTAVTPWGLIVRIAEMASAGGGGGGGLETAATAGLGAGLAKVTAGVMATGALVGGAAVGTHEVIRHDSAAPAQADVVHTTKPSSHTTTTREKPISLPAAATRTTPTSHPATRETEHHHGRDHRRGRSGRHGSDDSSSHHATATPLADDHRGGRGGGSDDTTEHSTSSGSGSGSGSGSSGSTRHGSDDSSTTSHSGSGKSGRSGTSETSGRSSGGGSSSDDTPTLSSPTPPTPSSTDSGSGSGKSSDDASSPSSSSTPTSGSNSSGSGKSTDDDSSGSGKSSDG